MVPIPITLAQILPPEADNPATNAAPDFIGRVRDFTHLPSKTAGFRQTPERDHP